MKAKFLESVPIQIFKQSDIKIRTILFQDIFDIVKNNIFSEVNIITPVLIRVQDAVPQELEVSFVQALFDQADSGAFQGEPAARNALCSLPEHLARIGLELLTAEQLMPINSQYLKTFVACYKVLWSLDRAVLYQDFIDLSNSKFVQKYYKEK